MDMNRMWAVWTLALVACGGGGAPSTPLPADPGAKAPAVAETASPVAFGLGWTGAGSDVAVTWDFGDGTQSAEARPSHSYAQPGSYSWTLTLRNGDGQTRQAAGTLTVGWFDRLDPASCTGPERSGWCWLQPDRPAIGVADVHFVDGQLGTLVDRLGRALVTRDGGRSWAPLALPGSVRALRMADADRGWALADEPMRLLRSDDGGRSWAAAPMQPPPIGPLNGTLLVRGPDSVLVMNTPGLDLEGASALTVDGGRSWSSLPSFHAYSTSSSGAVWGKFGAGTGFAPLVGDLVLPAPGELPFAVPGCCEGSFWYYGAALLDARRVVALNRPLSGGPLTLHRTDDAGKIWARTAPRLPAGLTSGGFDRMRLFDGGSGWAEVVSKLSPLSQVERSLLLHTRNAAADWEVAGEWIHEPGDGDEMEAIDAEFVRAGRRLLRADGRWQDLPGLPPDEAEAPTQVKRLADSGRWLLGYGGTSVFRGRWYATAADGGASARLPGNAGPETAAAAYVGMTFDNARDGLALRADGVLRTTRDGGRSWTTRSRVPIEPNEVLRSFQRAGATLWVTTLGRLYASVDRGATWQALPTPDLGVAEARLAEGGSGWVSVCTGFGHRSGGDCPRRLYGSTDGGQTWAALTDQGSWEHSAWADARTGVRAAIDGTVWRSTDAGRSWVQVGSGLYAGLPRLVELRNSGSSWIQAAGTTLRSDDAGRSWRAVDNLELRQLIFAGAQDLLALTERSLARSSDGGNTWRHQAPPTERPLSVLHALDRRTLWLEAGGALLTTSTAGD